jgi:Glutaredoxin-like domain (DUF836)
MFKSLTLYSTGACHLCERAHALLTSMPELRSVTVNVVDVATDDSLLARYGASIPVLTVASGAELGWPFNADDILRLLS